MATVMVAGMALTARNAGIAKLTIMMIHRTKFGSDQKPKYEPKFTNYTALKASRAEVYLASYKDVPYRSLPSLKGEKTKDINKYCRFHDDYGHETNECMHLKVEIELLL